MRSVDAACIALYCLMHVGVVVLISRLTADNAGELNKQWAETFQLGEYEELPSLFDYPASEELWLLIAIPTLRRKADYLTRTVHSLVNQLDALQEVSSEASQLVASIKVAIINQRPFGPRHQAFEQLKVQLRNDPRFLFLSNINPIQDPFISLEDPNDLNNTFDRPGKKVRRQSLDYLAMMNNPKLPKSEFFMFMEDDFPICPAALLTLKYLTTKSDLLLPSWIALRVSFGMNGILMRSQSLPSFSAYVWAYFPLKPIDLLFVRWIKHDFEDWKHRRYEITQEHPYLKYFNGINFGTAPIHVEEFSTLLASSDTSTRLVTFRWNLFQHIGLTSSLRLTGVQNPPVCWMSYSDQLWGFDGFDISMCEYDDISPCPPAHLPASRTEKRKNSISMFEHQLQEVVGIQQNPYRRIFLVSDNDQNRKRFLFCCGLRTHSSRWISTRFSVWWSRENSHHIRDIQGPRIVFIVPSSDESTFLWVLFCNVCELIITRDHK